MSGAATSTQGGGTDTHLVMETDRHEVRFRLTLLAMILLLFVVPIGVAKAFDLDARTPVSIAEDTLREEYGLRLVDDAGHVIPKDSGTPTLSEFSLEPGATTENVPFKLNGKLVHCTIEAPSNDPRSVTASCS